jgi:hypothetical protein
VHQAEEENHQTEAGGTGEKSEESAFQPMKFQVQSPQ